MSKRKTVQPTQSPISAFVEGMTPFLGPIVIAAGFFLYVLSGAELQIPAMICWVVGGLLTGRWLAKRRDRRAEAQKALIRHEKKQARKEARAARLAGGDDQDLEDDDNSESDTA